MHRQAETKFYHCRMCIELQHSWYKKCSMTFSVHRPSWVFNLLNREYDGLRARCEETMVYAHKLRDMIFCSAGEDV